MNSIAISVVIIPGFVSVLLFLVFTYLHEQSRQAYFRAWQLAWAAYSLHYALDAFSFYRAPSAAAFFADPSAGRLPSRCSHWRWPCGLY